MALAGATVIMVIGASERADALSTRAMSGPLASQEGRPLPPNTKSCPRRHNERGSDRYRVSDLLHRHGAHTLAQG